jgi:hypothetical protein
MAKMPALSHVITFRIEHGEEKSGATFAETVPAVAQVDSGKKNETNTFLLTR